MRHHSLRLVHRHHLPEVDRADALGQPHHHMHIVFHQNNRDVQLLVYISQDFRHLLGLFGVHPRHRLIQQQHIG